ncbi:chromate transporter [Candidatus Pseudoscillospira sp. SGI.172]|uniref:chromate transporter n=1 Tax=Candidatus Pseudoscillospira sp. SGI.172 TaxID=3420582 RepID=UPI0009B96B7B|nr:chromate transporter [Pseudoflavonifractor sp.]MDY3020387.1 chromate transporter [Oscillospiraceae bacterium]
MKRLFEIFLVFFKIGLFTIGGGYAMLPIIQREVVETKHWMTDEEFLDAISLTNSLPGPLATNSATFVGYRVARAPGSVAAVLGAATPSVIIILLIAMVFHNIMDYPVTQYIFNGVRPAVAALILYAVVKLAKSAKVGAYFNWIVALFGFVAVAVFGLHPIVVVVCSAAYGLLLRGQVVKAVDAHREKKEESK